jgi:short-chain fatty acids transporter
MFSLQHPATVGAQVYFEQFIENPSWEVESGGGKWIIEAPYVMQAANDLKVHLGWAVQVYTAADALPNLINPFWMLPLLGVLGLKPRDIVGFTFLQFIVHVPVVLFLLWFFAGTLIYMPHISSDFSGLGR